MEVAKEIERREGRDLVWNLDLDLSVRRIAYVGVLGGSGRVRDDSKYHMEIMLKGAVGFLHDCVCEILAEKVLVAVKQILDILQGSSFIS